LNYWNPSPVKPETMLKGRPMWIYDGEQWIEEGANENAKKPDQTMPRLDEFVPELQVVEITPLPRTNHVPFPLP
jgi:hypothetical protein